MVHTLQRRAQGRGFCLLIPLCLAEVGQASQLSDMSLFQQACLQSCSWYSWCIARTLPVQMAPTQAANMPRVICLDGMCSHSAIHPACPPHDPVEMCVCKPLAVKGWPCVHSFPPLMQWGTHTERIAVLCSAVLQISSAWRCYTCAIERIKPLISVSLIHSPLKVMENLLLASWCFESYPMHFISLLHKGK